jgi:DNA-binding NarL/FixJ family response regulator
MRILLVDDQVLFREGVFGLIDAQPDLEVVGEAGSVAEAIAQARKLRPDLILMDFSLPDGTGLDATRAILADLPEIKIVFLTFHDDDVRLFDAIRAGGKGYLLKNVSTSNLLKYLREVEAGGAALTPDLTSRLVHEFARLEPQSRSHRGAASELTARELDVLRILVTGASNREIASQLVISENTVKNHMRNILAKLNLKNRREAAKFARRNGLA